MSRESIKNQNRQRILDEGVSLLMEHGYHGTGINEIVKAVSIPKGSFYNYFKSKDDFAAQVITHYIEPYIRQVEACLGASQGDALGALRRYYDLLVQEQEGRNFHGGCLLGNLLGEIGDTNEPCRNALAAAVSRYRDVLKGAVENAQKEGTARTDRSAEELADFLLEAWQGALLSMKLLQSSRPLKKCIEHLLNDYLKP